MIKVLFVCLGNICRSPTAHGIFEALICDQNLQDRISVDSAGTSDWHVGHAPDPRTTQAAHNRGFDLSRLRARQVCEEDFSQFDYIIAMDKENLGNLTAMMPADFKGELNLFLPYDSLLTLSEVPDPYYSKGDGFENVLDLVSSASEALLKHILHQHTL